MPQDPESRYEWIYEKNPHGAALTWLAEDRDSEQVVGCLSCFPRRFHVGEAEILGAVGGDAFVHLDWRRRGIIGALIASINRELTGTDISFHLGFASLANHRALVSGGSSACSRFRKLVLPLAGTSLRRLPFAIFGRLRRRSQLRRNSNLAFGEISALDDSRWEDAAHLWQEARKDLAVCTVRDAAYFRWRYEEVPGEKPLIVGCSTAGQLEAFAAVIRQGPNYEIFDFFSRNTEAARELLARLGDFLRQRGAEQLSMIMSTNSPYYCEFRRLVFVPREAIPLLVYLSADCGLPTKARDASRWHLVLADLD